MGEKGVVEEREKVGEKGVVEEREKEKIERRRENEQESQ